MRYESKHSYMHLLLTAKSDCNTWSSNEVANNWETLLEFIMLKTCTTSLSWGGQVIVENNLVMWSG
jgi:hypothetical protein